MEHLLEMLFSQRRDQIKEDLSNTHSGYMFLANKCEELYVNIRPIMAQQNQTITICEEDIRDIRSYIDALGQQSAILEEEFYQKGFWDGIRLLKYFVALA